ncbi:LysR family transcriptional regulator [Gordonia sp. HY002]|uniref:LysR family transcriptional regulator n=1 Tax=Gordonia zhenghanii TaxID=2911516 RepID=UPI001EF0E619|nr:LysR family transcriptional regulator [Gordonia zhenghanii]MCF8569290.1 LysR family transcriptional regulator [Gordonia zhenghanii]MCF8607200.1 LysR family transcriptional regulator [Gordonia zhenghanii]
MDLRSLDLGALELLVGVDDQGSLSAAARACGIAQPNASRSIARLERQLGVPLLKRATAGSKLTPHGTVLVHWARRTVDDATRLLDVASGLHVDHTAELTVGASMTVAEHLLPRWLGTFRSRFPEVTVHLRVQNSSTVFVSLANDACDLGFVESPTVPSKLCSTVVARDRLVLVVPPEHAWTRRRRQVTAEELAATGLLVREPGSGTRTTLDEALSEYRRAEPLLELGSSAAIRTSVAAGVGPAVLSTLAIADDARSGTVRTVDVAGLDLSRSLRAVWRPPRELTGPAADLVRIAKADIR